MMKRLFDFVLSFFVSLPLSFRIRSDLRLKCIDAKHKILNYLQKESVFDFCSWKCIASRMQHFCQMEWQHSWKYLNIIYMFDDCRTVLTCSPTHSLIKLHAFCFTNRSKKERNYIVRIRFPYELLFIVSFQMRFCVCAETNGEWPFFIRCTQQHITIHWEWEYIKT